MRDDPARGRLQQGPCRIDQRLFGQVCARLQERWHSLHQCAARLTGLHPLRSSFWVDPRPHTVPVRLLLFTDDSPPARNMTEFERDLDLVLSFLQRMFLAKEHKLGSIYKGCKKDRNADTCAAYK